MQTFIYTMFLQWTFEVKQPFMANVWFGFFLISTPTPLYDTNHQN